MNYLTQSNAAAYAAEIVTTIRRRWRMSRLYDWYEAAQAIARKVTWGNYLINTPEEIAEHCRAAARGREAI